MHLQSTACCYATRRTCFVTAVQAMIMPGVRVGHGDGGPGCFTPTHEPAVTNGQLFGWEVRHLIVSRSPSVSCSAISAGDRSRSALVLPTACMPADRLKLNMHDAD